MLLKILLEAHPCGKLDLVHALIVGGARPRGEFCEPNRVYTVQEMIDEDEVAFQQIMDHGVVDPCDQAALQSLMSPEIMQMADEYGMNEPKNANF